MRHGVQLRKVKSSDLVRDESGFIVGIDRRVGCKGETFIFITKKNEGYAGFGQIK